MRRLALWSRGRLEAAGFPLGVWVLLGIGLALRLVWVSLHHVDPVSDFAAYDRLAYGLSLSGTYGPDVDPESYWPPGWPLLLGATYEVFGSDFQVGTVAAALLSWGATVAGAVIAVRLLRPAFAVAAVAAMSVYPAGIAFTAVLATEHLAALLLALMVAVMVRERVGAVTGLALGILDGALLLTRPEFGVAMAGTLLVFYLTRRRSIRRPALIAAYSAAGVLLVLSPWIIRNALTFGEFIPLTTSGGLTLYRGTIDLESAPDQVEGGTPSEESATSDTSLWRQALENVADHPLGWLELTVQRFDSLYLSEHNALDQAWIGQPPATVLDLANGFLFLLLALAVLGLWALAAQWRAIDPRWLPIVATVLGATALKVLFAVQGRQRIPLMVMLILLGAYGVQRAWELLGRARAARAVPGADRA
jgi:hypothetical protein